MTFITKRRLATLATGSALIATLGVASMPVAALAAKPTRHTVATPTSYYNGFENASDVIADASTPRQAMFDVTRVASRTNAIKAASGKWYATAATDAYVFTRLGGYSTTFPTNGYTTSVDIYLDMTMRSAATFSSTGARPSATRPAAHRRDFIFNVGTKPSVPGRSSVSASNNAPRQLPAGGPQIRSRSRRAAGTPSSMSSRTSTACCPLT